MGFIKEWILNLILDFFKDTAEKKIKTSEVNKRLTDFMNRQFESFEGSGLDEEFDYQGLFDYVTENLEDTLWIYLTGMQEERKRAKEEILSKGIEYASARKKCSEEKVKEILDNVLRIVYQFIEEQLDLKDLVVANRIVDQSASNLKQGFDNVEKALADMKRDIIDEINKQSEEAGGDIKKDEKLFIISDSINASLIKKEQERIENDVLLPWMKGSISYRAVFPGLFIEPDLYSGKRKKPVSFKELLGLKRKNLIITGEAGVGKTLLLRYIFLYKNLKKRILYLRAAVLLKDHEECNEYEKRVRRVLYGQEKMEVPILVFIDGIDEAYQDNWDLWNETVSKIEKLDKVSVWLGWRKDSYYRHETERIRLLFYDVLLLNDWDLDVAEGYVKQYADKTGQIELYDVYQNLLNRNISLEKFCQRPFQLVLLIYLIENKSRFPGIKNFLQSSDGTLYAFFTIFFECWVEKEKERGTSSKSVNELMGILQSVGLELYHRNSCEVKEEDTAVTDLLVYGGAAKNSKMAVAFYHRSFCEYFAASFVYHSLIEGKECMKKTLSRPLKNDITDLIREAYEVTEKQILQNIRENLITGYQSLQNSGSISNKTDLSAFTEQNIICMKNEIIYLLTRLPDKAGDVSEFLAEEYRYQKDPYMKLDFAYGAVLKGPFWIALEYARELYPGTEADIVHRSWTLVYLGDVNGDPYEYQDDGKVSWEKSKWGKLKRLNSKKIKDIRFRILDIPILYCFYSSRGWSKLNADELHIIENAEIECPEYNEEEREFLSGQKQKLVQEYRKRFI